MRKFSAGQVFQTQQSADAVAAFLFVGQDSRASHSWLLALQVSTVVEPGRFDDVLSSLLHGNIAIGSANDWLTGCLWLLLLLLPLLALSYPCVLFLLNVRSAKVMPHSDLGTGSSAFAAQEPGCLASGPSTMQESLRSNDATSSWPGLANFSSGFSGLAHMF